MSHDERDADERLSRLLASVRAEADPALWTRVRARIAAGERARVPAWLGWSMRPAALGASFALLAAAVTVSLTMVATTPAGSISTLASADDLGDALVVELDAGATVAAPAVAGDSGSVQ
jgi:hypothetical protein